MIKTAPITYESVKDFHAEQRVQRPEFVSSGP